MFFFQPAPLPPVEEQKKAGAYSKTTPLKGSKASTKKEDKTSQKKLFDPLQPDGKEDDSLLNSVTSSDIAALNSGGSDYNFSGTLDGMELTCLPPATPDDPAGAVGGERKDWNKMNEEDGFVSSPELASITEEETLEEQRTIEEDETMSFVTPSGLASSLFRPIRSLSGNNFPSFPDNFPLLLSNSIYSIPPFYLISAI